MKGREKPPFSVNVLQRWIADAERDGGVAVARQQRWVSFMLLAGMLDSVRDEDDQPVFILKGGVAMELRLGLAARATKDFDAAFRAEATEILGRLDQALRAGYGDFTARRTPPEPVRDTAALRFDIKLDYRSRPWATVKFEVAPAEGDMGREIDRLPAKPLDHLGLVGPVDVPCVAVRWQIAQKLHACTERPRGERANDRFRDLVDLLLLWDLVAAHQHSAVRHACREIFALRALHEWPPRVTVFDPWPAQYQALAAELNFPVVDVDIAASKLQEMIDEIDAR
ncbi:MAG: nucleotidyl transferase AbiEii/AbiGii toxin family protein [Acidimicrobiia bacterium]